MKILRDRMYAANLRHGVQYTREQKRAYGVEIARAGVIGEGNRYARLGVRREYGLPVDEGTARDDRG